MGDWLSGHHNKWKPRTILLNAIHVHLQKFHSTSNVTYITIFIYFNVGLFH